MFHLIPRELVFFDLLTAAMQNALQAARELRDMVEDYHVPSPQLQRIRDLEHEGDRITHELLDRLDRTFVVPLDREDLHALADGIDDIVDSLNMVAEHFILYRIANTTKEAVSLTRILVRCCEELAAVMPLLQTRGNSAEIDRHCIEINRLENMADKLAQDALTELFRAPDDLLAVIKWKEFYEALENAIDQTENVADLLKGVVLKAL
ncbi:MAG: DUF47 family protein [Cyanobacteria bacterium NC_groundwater_1444_Ag_S-0.65um_54_12]|nr:DUF47 family protein [Cyanobacteria bacterium NC_groundwater_1444_Ag_S-0.65um_54_12]